MNFKVLDSDKETFEYTLAVAYFRIAEKKDKTELVSRDFAPKKHIKCGFVFRGKKCLIG